ncbi:hypothetical protein BS47DRAFT_1395119 [Hydnum rufescens UP504]|uniref:Uncharacterized protein n=1 Tax=Hydnum rufescens UP504 TaxID=1448309 RepID=A0A9P6DUC1_9AGAM|nr:hypothetical protein BS47DRAFT_1395119 [Hydnum rufescens UP504]
MPMKPEAGTCNPIDTASVRGRGRVPNCSYPPGRPHLTKNARPHGRSLFRALGALFDYLDTEKLFDVGGSVEGSSNCARSMKRHAAVLVLSHSKAQSKDGLMLSLLDGRILNFRN